MLFCTMYVSSMHLIGYIYAQSSAYSVTPVVFCFFLYEKISFSNLLETLDSDRGPWDLDLSAKMEAVDPSRAEILRSHIAFIPLFL